MATRKLTALQEANQLAYPERFEEAKKAQQARWAAERTAYAQAAGRMAGTLKPSMESFNARTISGQDTQRAREMASGSLYPADRELALPGTYEVAPGVDVSREAYPEIVDREQFRRWEATGELPPSESETSGGLRPRTAGPAQLPAPLRYRIAPEGTPGAIPVRSIRSDKQIGPYMAQRSLAAKAAMPDYNYQPGRVPQNVPSRPPDMTMGDNRVPGGVTSPVLPTARSTEQARRPRESALRVTPGYEERGQRAKWFYDRGMDQTQTTSGAASSRVKNLVESVFVKGLVSPKQEEALFKTLSGSVDDLTEFIYALSNRVFGK